MNRSRDSFNDLLNPVTGNTCEHEEQVITGINADNDVILNSDISADEVNVALKAMKNNKAYQMYSVVYEPPAEVLKNDILKEVLRYLTSVSSPT